MKKEKTIGFLKTPTGIPGLDEITAGGLPKGRPTLVCGSPGCGKTLLGVEFLIKGITEYGEPGVFMSFEESRNDLVQNVRSLGIDMEKLIASNKLRIDQVVINRNEIEETGEYDLEGLFIRLNHAIDSIKAKRVVLDTIESLFSGIENAAILRSELRRLFQWLKEKGVTAIITGERGEKSLTRQGLEEYISDCVILIDFRVIDQMATRRMRIIKYRGSTHGTNEYPFLIDSNGISVLPITSLKLDHRISNEIISMGLPELDRLFSRNGIFRASSTLLSGPAGTGKTILASLFAQSSCKRGEKTLYMSFEESPDQLIRNMHSVGVNLKPCIKSKLLYINASRPTLTGLEMHLLLTHQLIDSYRPKTVIVDPISSLLSIGTFGEVRDMLVRLLDILKAKQINAYFTSLTHPGSGNQQDLAIDAVSSLADIWMDVTNEQKGDHRVRSFRIVKARGMGHVTERQKFEITGKGVRFLGIEKPVNLLQNNINQVA